jgi:hypothetical protein
MKVTACECAEPGWCPRHQCFKNELDFQLCRRRLDYFQAWEERRGPGQGKIGSARVSDPAEGADRRSPEAPSSALFLARLPCRHRGAVIGTRECEACKGRVRLKLFRCDVHGCCTTTRHAEGAACCAQCDGYELQLSPSEGE